MCLRKKVPCLGMIQICWPWCLLSVWQSSLPPCWCCKKELETTTIWYYFSMQSGVNGGLRCSGWHQPSPVWPIRLALGDQPDLPTATLILLQQHWTREGSWLAVCNMLSLISCVILHVYVSTLSEKRLRLSWYTTVRLHWQGRKQKLC